MCKCLDIFPIFFYYWPRATLRDSSAINVIHPQDCFLHEIKNYVTHKFVRE